MYFCLSVGLTVCLSSTVQDSKSGQVNFQSSTEQILKVNYSSVSEQDSNLPCVEDNKKE